MKITKIANVVSFTSFYFILLHSLRAIRALACDVERANAARKISES